MTAASRAQDTQVVSEEDVKNWFSDSSSGLAKQCVELANWLRMNKVSFTSSYQSRKHSHTIALVCQPGTGRLGALHFAWCLPDAQSEQLDLHTHMAALLANEVLPNILSSDMEARVRAACSHPAVNIAPALMNHILKEVGLC